MRVTQQMGATTAVRTDSEKFKLGYQGETPPNHYLAKGGTIPAPH